MNIKIDASFFSLKCKPSLLRPLNPHLLNDQTGNDSNRQDYQFNFLQQFATVDHTINFFKSELNKLFNQNSIIIFSDKQIRCFDFLKVDKLLQKIKKFLEKCQYYNLILISKQFLSRNSGFYQLCQFPQTLKTCYLLTEIQKLSLSVGKDIENCQNQKLFPSFQLLQKVTIKQLPTILRFLKENLYIPSIDLLENVLEKYDLRFDESFSMVKNMAQNKLDLSKIQDIQIYYQILIYKNCSSLKGICQFLTFTKNILLDKKSGALAADHQLWVAIYQTCLRLYIRNPQIRQHKWLEIDQILSMTYFDEEFSDFLLTEKVDSISLASFNFYMKNLDKPEQQRLFQVAELKIMSLIDSGLVWKEAEDIVEYLNNACSAEKKQQIYNKIIALIDGIFLSNQISDMPNEQFFQLKMGLTYFIESMCKNLHVTQKIFNKANLRLIVEILQKSQENKKLIQIVHHIFCQFIINSFEESDELGFYMQNNQQIIGEIVPQIIRLFRKYNYTLPKQLYKIIFHSSSDIQDIDPIIWKGIAELYFTQSFQETIDLEMFHNDRQSKRKISDQIVEMIKELTINNSKENLIISNSFQSDSVSKSQFRTFLELKSFKDELIFNNLLMMSTYFGQFLPLSQLSQILKEFYSPLVSDIRWKSVQNETLTVLSFLSEQLPIDVLKVTYKFLKNGYVIDIKMLNSLSTDFWNLYFSGESEKKIQAVLSQKQLTFQSYQNLHALKSLELVFNMINCVFDKLNEHSQKSIKQLKLMYEWGVQYIEQLQPYIYQILLKSLSKSFAILSGSYNESNVDNFEIYNRSKNISLLDLHLSGKYNIFQTLKDLNKIGQIIQHQKALKIASVMYPCFVKQSQHDKKQKLDECQILQTIFKTFVLMQNSCLEEVMSDNYLVKVSKIHIENQDYFEKAQKVFSELKRIFQNPQHKQEINNFSEKPLYKRLISHLKLLMGKIYIPYIVKTAFIPSQSMKKQHNKMEGKDLVTKFTLLKTTVEIIFILDPLFQQHFAELMQVIEQNCQSSQKKQKSEVINQKIKSQILLKTLQMFIQCVLSNIKVRSFHIFKLIKLYLSETKTEIQPINQVIKFYIDLLFSQFLKKDNYSCYNQQVREKSHFHKKSDKIDNETSRVKILTLQKNKQPSSFMDKILSPLKKDKISLESIKMKKLPKSQFQALQGHEQQILKKQQTKEFAQNDTQLPQQFKKLIIKQHNLNTIQTSCTLSMFINLFARLNFSSLPSGVQAMLTRQNDKIVYLDYLMQLTQKLKDKQCSKSISSREMEILNIDVYGNLSCVLKGKVNEEILNKFVKLAKKTLQLSLPEQSVVTLPIRLLNQRLFCRPVRKLGAPQTNINSFNQISKLISQFQQQPLAFQLTIKSHLLKIFPFIKSNLHICNLEYIVGNGKTSVSKKILETNHKLVESILGRNLSKQFFKKYQKSIVKKQTLNIQLPSSAIQQIDKILLKYAQFYRNLSCYSEQNVVRLYFYFRKICAIVYFAPELIPHILTRRLKINENEMTFLQTILESLHFTLVLFCEFYVTCLKINCGFCSKSELKQIISQTSPRFQLTIDEKIQKLTGKMPLNAVLEIYMKLRLLQKTRQQGKNNLNALRGLSFAIKQSQKSRFRFYKFIKINSPEHQDLIKKVDQEILEFLLSQLNENNGNLKQKSNHHKISSESLPVNLVNKIELMDLCLQHILSHTMVDYAKMKLDDRLKETFYHSQYSIKCLQSMTNGMNTLKVLQQDEEDNKSCSQADEDRSLSSSKRDIGLQIEQVESNTLIDSQVEIKSIKNENTSRKVNVFDELEIIRELQCGNIGNLKNRNSISQQLISNSKAKGNVQLLLLIEQCTDSEVISAKQIGELKQWLGCCTLNNNEDRNQFNQTNNKTNSVLLNQMQRNIEKLANKESLSFGFENAVYLDPQHTDQLEITAFAVSENSNMSIDCCIEDTSLAEIPMIGNNGNNQNSRSGVIVQSFQSINEDIEQLQRNQFNDRDGIKEEQQEQPMQENNQNRRQEDGIIEDESDNDEDKIIQYGQDIMQQQNGDKYDGIKEQEDDQQIDQQQQSQQKISYIQQCDIKISIVEQTHVNKYEVGYRINQGQGNRNNADSIVEIHQEEETNVGIESQDIITKGENYEEIDENMDDDQEEEGEAFKAGTDGSIQFTSIKTLGAINDSIQLQQVSQQNIHEPEYNNLPPPQILLNGTQQRQFHYTIDNLTLQGEQASLKNIQNSSLIDSLETEAINSNQPVTKESIFSLIEEYTLNPQILRIIKLKLKKISNSELKKVQTIVFDDLKDEVERQMRSRGIYVALSPRSYEQTHQGSVFSINKFINESFQVDESKFYAANFKRCDKKTQQKQKIDHIPRLNFNQWTQFVLIYLGKSKQNQLKNKLQTHTLLQVKGLNDLLIKLLCNRENLLEFLQVLLNLISLEKIEEIVTFFETHTGLNGLQKKYSQIFRNLNNLILNELIAKLIVNRIGLPVLFKGKWNYETRKLIRYEFTCLISDSNINNNRSQGDPLLQVFLRKAIQLIYIEQLNQNSEKQKPNNSNNESQQNNFVRSLTDYFKCVQSFQTNEYPYYSIQDTIKLSNNSVNKYRQSLLNINYTARQPMFFSDRLRMSLCETLLNTMKASKIQSLSQYEEVFHLMNQLDFQTFSEFLQLIVQRCKPLCEKLLDREISILKRFKKSSFNEFIKQEKLAEIYWHMRKSSKSSLSTDHDEKDLQFFAKLISSFSSTIFQKFKESIFKFGYGKQETKRKEKISLLKKMLTNPTYQNKYKSIKQELVENEKEYFMWKLNKNTEILKQDILPIIEKISASFNQCLKKWENLFLELEEVFGTQREQRFILYKQCSEFYKIFLSLEMLHQQDQSSMIRTMSFLKTKPSLQSTRDMGVTGRRRSSLKLPRVSLVSSLCLSTLNAPTFKSVFKSISPKFGFFSQMIDQNCPQLKIHAKYSNLESKLKLLHQKNKGGQLTIEVKRNNIWQDTLPYLNESIADKNVKIKIVDQIGLDYGGIRRQWITLIVKELVNPNLGLFELSVNGLAFQPSALSFLVPYHLYHFHKLGILVGKALKQNWLLEINFTKSFLKHILGYTLYVEDLQDIDPQTTKSLLWILNNDVGEGDLGIDFTFEFDILGNKKCIELIQNGKQIQVSEFNKKDYVKKLANYKMTEQIREQSKAFMNGLEKVVPYETLKLFSYKQLGIYLAGMPTVDVQEMKKYTRYQNFSPNDQSIKWFWEILTTYSEEEKANFLFFLTASYKVPYGGFKQNPITINKMPASKDYLPVAHTCFSVIDLPQYTSKDKLSFLLQKSIKQGKGFSVS